MILFLLAAQAAPTDDLVKPDALEAWSTPSGTAVNTGPWWRTFEDEGLNAIVEAAVGSNRDIAAAFARTRAVESQASGSVSALLPTLTFDMSGQLAPTASRGFQFGGFGSIPGAPEPPATFWTGQAALNAGWELDLFLRNQQSVRASRHDALASSGDRNAALLAFTTRVVEGYYDVVTARARVAIVEQQVASARTLLEIVDLRYQAGDASAVELLQQRQTTASVEGQLPLARANAQVLAQQLAVALGLPPATVVPGVAPELPTLPPMPDAGVPADLIANRPDLVAAEERVVAATSRKHNAVRQLLPTVRLSGAAGWQVFNETEFKSQTFWNAGATVSVPIFNGGRRYYGIDTARQQEHASVHAYTQLAANAVLEVESALFFEAQRAIHLEAMMAQAEAATAALEKATEQYIRGINSHLGLLTSQNAHNAAQLALLDSRRQLLSARIQLHDALGGGWVDSVAQSLRGEDR